MTWYPGAIRMELQPESDNQPPIRPTQFIMHSIAAPWTPQRTYEFWRDSTNLESHFGLGYDGSIAQYIGTQTRADASYKANLRSDGTGAVSIETASDDDASDPWTPEQVEQLIRLGVWLHEQHGIPLRICRTWDDPGYGYHRLHAAWAVSGTDCPGDARVQQFHTTIFPGIVARATGASTPSQEDDMPTPMELWAYKGKDELIDAYAYLVTTNKKLAVLAKQVTDLTTQVASLTTTGLTPEQITAIANATANAVADVQAERLTN